MNDKKFHLEIITPRKIVFQGDVLSFSAPGVVGGFQVLFNHAPLFASIGIGVIKLVDSAGKQHTYATSGGIVEVLKNKVVVLAETIESPDEIDIVRAEAARERARKRLKERKPDLDVERAQLALLRALNRLKVAKSL
ncbi:MAG: F0F1 ATP synthase subunit epsilon [Bacteroidetes bacterium]|nr:F0F1 ATP synthase subunit epsilon [Bacteroidota bacterium]